MFPKKSTPLLILCAIACTSTLRAVDGRQVFNTNCASCHGVDGKARTPAGKALGAKDLCASKLSDAEIEKQITNGVQDASGKQRMPAFKSRLTAEEITALVAHVKTFRN